MKNLREWQSVSTIRRTGKNALLSLAAVHLMCLPATAQVSQETLESISTPDQVETSIGTLEFFDGIPTRETAELLYDNLHFLRGVETFLNGIPATSMEGIRRGHESLGAGSSNQALIFDTLMDSKPLWLTGNTDMTDGTVDGGETDIYSLGVNWWFTRSTHLSLDYRYITPDRFVARKGTARNLMDGFC